MDVTLAERVTLLLPASEEVERLLAEGAPEDELSEAVLRWLCDVEDAHPDWTVEDLLTQAALRREGDSLSLCAASALWDWVWDLTGSPRAQARSIHCTLVAMGFVMLERWEGRSLRMRRAFAPLRQALERRAPRDELERALHEVQRHIKDSRPPEGPNDDPGSGVPRHPTPPAQPAREARRA